MQHIKHASAEPSYHVRLTFDDEVSLLVNFAPIIVQGGVFARLADPAIFNAVSIGEAGRYLEWPGEIDFCADALRQMAVPPAE